MNKLIHMKKKKIVINNLIIGCGKPFKIVKNDNKEYM